MDLKLSVVMSAFNSSKWIEESIKSVLAQSFKNFEFIIVNDGSTDSTSEILEKYQSIDNRIIIITKKNTGLTNSLNIGIKKSKTGLILRIDSDDISSKKRFKRQYDYMKYNPQCGLLSGNCIEINQSNNTLFKHIYPNSHDKIIKNLEMGKNVIPHSAVIFRKDLFNDVGGYRETFKRSQDIDLWLRLSEVAKINSLPGEPIVRIRKHSSSLTHDEITHFTNMSIISYMSRKSGRQDPVESENKIIFDEFIKQYSFGSYNINKNRVYRSISLIRRNYKMESIKSLILFINLIFSKYSYIVAYERLFNVNPYNSLFKKWENKLNEKR